MKILAVKLRSLGDTVLFTASLAELVRCFPQAEIHVLVRSQWAGVLEGHPGIHKVWTWDPPSGLVAKLRDFSQWAIRLRREKFDIAIHFHASSSSAWLTRMTGAKVRSIHFHGYQQPNRFSTVEIPGKGVTKPIIERDLDALRALGLVVSSEKGPRVFLESIEIQEALSFLAKKGLKSPVLAISLGASRPTKCWPLEKFAVLALNWALKTQGSVLAFVGPKEGKILEEFQSQVSHFLITRLPDPKQRLEVQGRLVSSQDFPIRKLAAILSQVSVLLGNDSGPKHLTVAVGTPTVTLFGPEHPFEWHPYSKDQHSYFFIESLECRQSADAGAPPWCGLQECVIENHQCMKKIEEDSVLKECERLARV